MFVEKINLFIIAFLLAGIENFIPTVPLLPWLKIGLFHSVTLLWIYRFGIVDSLAFIFVRQWVIAAFFGFSVIPFVLGTTGAVFSVILGGFLIKTRLFGVISIAIFSALVHNITQLTVLSMIMKGNFVWQWQLPIMSAVSLGTGTITGLLAFEINKISFDNLIKIHVNQAKTNGKIKFLTIFLLISVIILTVMFENYWFYLFLFIIIVIISKQNMYLFVKRYGIFMFALYLSSLFSQKIEFYNYNFWIFPLIHISKVSLWFMLTPFFQRSGFFIMFYGLLLKVFPKKCSETLSVGAIMPQIFPQILEELPSIIKVIFKKPKEVVRIVTENSEKILADWQNIHKYKE